MSLINLPKTNQTGTNEWADVQDNDDAIVAVVNGDLDDSNIASGAAIDLAKIDVGSGVTDAQLASPNNSVYRTIAYADSFLFEAASGFYLLGAGTNKTSGGTFSVITQPPMTIWLSSSDYAVAGKTTKLRLRGTVIANATAPAVTFSFGLLPLSAVAGGGGEISYTIGAAVTGSSVSAASPPANSATAVTGSDFTFPAIAPSYLLGVTVSGGTMAANSVVSAHAHLQVRNV